MPTLDAVSSSAPLSNDLQLLDEAFDDLLAELEISAMYDADASTDEET